MVRVEGLGLGQMVAITMTGVEMRIGVRIRTTASCANRIIITERGRNRGTWEGHRCRHSRRHQMDS